LYQLRQDPAVELVGLLTTFNTAADRVAMHAVRRELVQQQAAATGLPLIEVELPWPCSNDDYERVVAQALVRQREQHGVEQVAFGDLYLEDVRAYRERHMAELGVKPIFPLWGSDTATLAREMVAAGLRAYVTCIDPQQLDAAFAGRIFNAAFLDDLPAGADACAESGEFHSFAFAGPMFAADIPVRLGDVLERDGFIYADLLPA
jgi:uncharacterized protein (TIGR00290 family)